MMKIAEIRITEALWPEDRAPIAHLMSEYVEALEADISFQDFESECADLPGKYARPEGVVLIAWTADEAVGCCQVNSSRSEKPESRMGDHTAATAFRHSLAASARKIRSVDRETRWR